jgi:SMI1-KNR4 cell-wall
MTGVGQRMKYTKTAATAPPQKKVLLSEDIFRLKYPKDFIDFMKQNNCGAPLDAYRCFDSSNNTKVIDHFLGLMENYSTNPLGYYDIGVVWSQINDRMGIIGDELGSKMLPIVALEFGDYVCFDWRYSPEAPEVVLWDHEQSRPNEPPHVELIAKSFTEFLGKLKPLPPFDESLLNEQ